MTSESIPRGYQAMMNSVTEIQQQVQGVTLHQLCAHITEGSWGAGEVLATLLGVCTDPRITAWREHALEGAEPRTCMLLTSEAVNFLFGGKSIRRPLESLEKRRYLRYGPCRHGGASARAIYFKFNNINEAILNAAAEWFDPRNARKKVAGAKLARWLQRAAPQTVHTTGFWCLASGALARACARDFESTLTLVDTRMRGRSNRYDFLRDLRALDPRHAVARCNEPLEYTWSPFRERERHLSERVRDTLFTFQTVDNPEEDRRWVGSSNEDRLASQMHLQGRLNLVDLQFVGVAIKLLRGGEGLDGFHNLRVVVDNLSDASNTCWDLLGWSAPDYGCSDERAARLTHLLLNYFTTLGWIEQQLNARRKNSEALLHSMVVKNGGYGGITNLLNLGLFLNIFPGEIALVRKYLHLRPARAGNNESAFAESKALSELDQKIYTALVPAVINLAKGEK